MSVRKKILYDIDLNSNQILNQVIENVTTDPTGTGIVTGRIIYNSTEKVQKYYNGTEWITLASSSSQGDLETRVDTLGSTVNKNTVKAGDTSVSVTATGSETDGTTIKVNLKSTDNDIKLDATNGGIYSTPYTADGTTIEKTGNQFSVKSGVFDASGAAATAKSEAITESKSYTDTNAIGKATDTSASLTLYGVKAYAKEQADAASAGYVAADTALETKLVGSTSDTKDSDTIAGAKKYADDAVSTSESTIIGSASDASTANTINGAKNFATAAINALDKADTAVANQFVTAVSEADGIVSVTRAQATSDDIKVGTDSTVTAKLTELANADTTNLAAAETYTDSEIAKLDVTDTAVANQFVTAVNETDGKVSITRSAVVAEGVTVTETGNHFITKTVTEALTELYASSGAGAKVTCTEGGASGDVVKSYTFYQGGSAESNKIVTVNIPKDLVVTGGSVVNGTWNDGTFTEDASGTGKAIKLIIANQTDPIYINVLDLVDTYTGGNGVLISGTNVISIVLDPTTETFLTVDADGIKLSGVQTAINTAKTEAIAVANTNKTTIDAYTVNGKAISTNPTLSGADVVVTGYTKAAAAASIAATDTVNVALGKLEKSLEGTSGGADARIAALEASQATQDTDITNLQNSVTTINGDSSTAGSIAKAAADTLSTAEAYSDANKTTVEAHTINTKALSTNPVLNGADIALTGYVVPTKSETGGDSVAATDTINAAIQKIMAQMVHCYTTTVTSNSTVSIQASLHKCGTTPIVKTYLGGEEVECAISLNSDGDLSISWNGTIVSASSPMTIKVIG